MDIGSIGLQQSQADSDTSRLLKELGDMKSSLSALMGKGGAGGKSWSNYSSTQPGKGAYGFGSGGKGFGKSGGKGPSATQIALRRAGGDYSKVLCPTELRTGKCDYEARNPGKKCRFMHAKNVPKSLSGIEGLIASDLAGVNVSYDARDGSYVCSDKVGAQVSGVSDTTFANVVSQECQKASEELLSEFVILEPGAEGGAGETGGAGFPRHSP